jgi:tripartite-type tricarboxylate transporter receptor subunit TctC
MHKFSNVAPASAHDSCWYSLALPLFRDGRQRAAIRQGLEMNGATPACYKTEGNAMRRMKRWLRTFAIGGALAVLATPSLAEPWPQRVVRLIVPGSAGTGGDISARLFAERLAERWKRPVVVENRPGADGLIGVAAFAGMHDDHALLFSFSAPFSVFPVIQGKLPYDPVLDIVPISSAVDTFPVVSVPVSLKLGALSELVALARAQPGKLNYTTAGGGAFTVLAVGFMRSVGIDMVQVNYREANLALQDLTEGRIQVALAQLTVVMPLIQAGKVRVLAVTNKMRAPMIPDVPTAGEAGYPELSFEGLQGFFGPRGMPADRRDQISGDVRAVAADPTIADRMAVLGQVPHGSTPTEFTSAIEAQRVQMATIAQVIGLKPTQ